MRHELITRTMVLLDPIGGGTDMGLQPRKVHGRLKEKDVNLAVCYSLAGYLLASGIDVRMTRHDDSTVSIPQRIEMANSLSPNIILSVGMGEKNLYWPSIRVYDYGINSEICCDFLKRAIDGMGLYDNNDVRIMRKRDGLVGKTYAPCIRLAIGNITKWISHVEKFQDADFIQGYARVLANALLHSFKRITWSNPEPASAVLSGL